MADSQDFQQRIQRIGDLVKQFEGAADLALRAAAKELVQLLMEFHGSALERMMDLVFHSGAGGADIIDHIGRDPLVSGLLILHGLHPEGVESRVSKALDCIAPQLRKHGSEIELLSVEAGAVRLRIESGEHACSSTLKSLRAIVEEAIYDAAPDVTSLTIEGGDGHKAAGFVALEALLGGQSSSPGVTASDGGD